MDREGMNPGFYRLKLGSYEAIALHEGVLERERPPGFVRNATDEEVGDAFAQLGMARDKLTITFTCLAIDTGDGVVLIDTGLGQSGPPGTGNLLRNMQQAGIGAGDVSDVIISHGHVDHIAGLRGSDGALTFPKATIHMPATELDFWLDPARRASAPDAMKQYFDVAERMLGPSAADIRRFAWGDVVRPGFTAVEAGGHTPGMAAIQIESDGHSLLYVADITNNPLIFARHPTWQAMFDLDGPRAVETRRRLFDRAAEERQRLFFFHAPFPGLATLAKNGDRYEYLPLLWRPSRS